MDGWRLSAVVHGLSVGRVAWVGRGALVCELRSPFRMPVASSGKEAIYRAAASPRLQDLTQRLLLSAVASRDGGASAQGVKWWLRFNVLGAGLSPVQHLDSTSPRWQKLEAESRLMNFVTWLVVCRPSGRPISTRSARKYVSQVVTWMRRVYSADFAGGLDLQNLRDLLKGMRRELGDTPVRRRYGVRTQHLRQAMDLCLPRKCRRRAVRSMRALLAVAFCGLLRGGEAALPDGEEFDPRKHLTRGDIRFFTLPDGRRAAVLVIYQAKNSKQLTYKTVPVYLVGGGTLIDPIAELERMLELDPVAEDMRSVTPLFRDDAGAAFRRRDVSRAVKSLMESIGLDPGCFGAHSLRIGGATAALAAGVHPSVIRITGRWSSDVWQIYARLSKQSALGVSMVIGSMPFDDCERGEFMSEELELMPEEMASLGDAHFPVDGVESDSD